MKKIIYNEQYFNGKRAEYSHNAGYSNYDAQKNDILRSFNKLQRGYKFLEPILELGCAKGYIVERLLELNYNVKGVDVSSFAISEAEKELQPHLIISEAISFLESQPDNSYGTIFSRWFIECLTNEELIKIAPQINRVGINQLHYTNSFSNINFYNSKKPIEYKEFGFENVLITNGTNTEDYINM